MRTSVIVCLLWMMAISMVVVSAQNPRIRLVNTIGSAVQGRLEVQYGGNWFSVCQSNGGSTLGNWVCGQLGLGTYKSTANFGQQSPENAIVTFACSSGQTLDQCTHTGVSTSCTDFGLVCSAVECVVTMWSSWSSCTASCGGGTQTQTRTVSVAPTPPLTCPALVNTRACNTQPCGPCSIPSQVVNGVYTTCVTQGAPDGGICPLTCDTGYQKVGTEQVCSGGIYQGSPPTCQGCQTFGCVAYVSGGGCACAQCSSQYTLSNGQCGCATGYELVAGNCFPLNCTAPDPVPHGMYFSCATDGANSGDSCPLTCEVGYQKSGSDPTCSLGSYTGAPPTCVECQVSECLSYDCGCTCNACQQPYQLLDGVCVSA